MNGVNVRRALVGLIALCGTAIASASNVDKIVVYSMSNEFSGNRIFAWYVGSLGNFTPAGTYVTRGRGSGTMETPLAGPNDGIDPLGSQGSLTLSPDGKWLYAVNAAGGSVTVFRVLPTGRLVFADVKQTLGKNPVSVTSNGNLVVVANVNDPTTLVPATLTTFRQNAAGNLTVIPQSVHQLSGPMARPSQVSFSPDLSQVIVTERETNVIEIFNMHRDGTMALASITPSVRPAPFGFAFSGNNFVVSEAAPGSPLGSSVSSYALNPPSGLSTQVISAGILNGQQASCWTTINPAGNRAYTSNTVSQTISSYNVAGDGTVTLREPAIVTGASPIDSGMSADGKLFFQLMGEKSAIVVYAVDANGDLNLIGIRHTPMPAFGVQGLVVSR
jgi:6-phosphogluconolactonase (cycloisomerase 2 family)